MFARVNPQELLNRVDRFIQEEVQYNLFYLITESGEALAIKSLDDEVLLAQSAKGSAWLWVDSNKWNEERRGLLEGLIDELDGENIRGVASEPETAKLFADLYTAKYKLSITSRIDLEAYACPRIIPQEGISGCLRAACPEDVKLVAQYLSGFAKDAYGFVVDPKSQIEDAEMMIHKGGLYMWDVDGHTVSMAQIAHRSSRHGRINAVFTSREERRRGYAGAVVSGLCSILLKEGRIPILYADLVNPASNRAYQKIGFIAAGKISDIKFK